MKKILLVVMSIIMVLSLCACGGKDASGNGSLLSSEPTEQENEVISTYVNILNALESYLEDSSISIYNAEIEEDVEGSQALEYCYKTIQELESVDKWIGTEYISDTRTRKAVLDAFTVIENVLLQDVFSQLDYVGEPKGETYIADYVYNEKGLLIEENNQEYIYHPSYHFSLFEMKKIPLYIEYLGAAHCNYSYNDKGQLVEYWIDSVRVTPTYDESGNITYVELVDREEGPLESYKVVCEGQNRISSMEGKYLGNTGETYTYKYSYDDADNRIKEEHYTYSGDERYLGHSEVEYTYDSKGNVISGRRNFYNGQEKVGSHDFSTVYDEEGNLITIKYNRNNVDGTVDMAFKCDRTYGDLYIYNPNM